MAKRVKANKEASLVIYLTNWLKRNLGTLIQVILAVHAFISLTLALVLTIDAFKSAGKQPVHFLKLGLAIFVFMAGVAVLIFLSRRSMRPNFLEIKQEDVKTPELQVLEAILEQYVPSSDQLRFVQVPLQIKKSRFDVAWILKQGLWNIAKNHPDIFTPHTMPPIDPTLELKGEWRDDFQDLRSKKGSAEQEKILYWTSLLQMHQDRTQMLQFFKPDSDCIISFGFLALNQKKGMQESDSTMVFGIIINLFRPKTGTYLERATEFGLIDSLIILETLKIGPYNFPVLLKTIEFIPHCSHPHPINGTTACFAKEVPEGQSLEILTSKHVTGTDIGAKISFTCGKYGYLTRVGPDGVDAAMVSLPECSATNPGALKTAKYIIAYSDVIIHCQNGQQIPATISSITDSKGLYKQNLIPIRILLNKHGSPGDSGSLVTNRKGNAVGIYMGVVKSKSRVTEGIVQHVGQVTGTMNIQLYK